MKRHTHKCERREAFVKSYFAKGCSNTIAACVYDELRNAVGPFKRLLPDSRLCEDLGIDARFGVPLDDVVEDIACHLSLELPRSDQPIVMITVDDLVVFFWHLSTGGPDGA